jgi:hypothetical protein
VAVAAAASVGALVGVVPPDAHAATTSAMRTTEMSRT